MTTFYAPPLSYSHARRGEFWGREALTEGPTYVRTRAATRWHMVRSAVVTLDEWIDDGLRTTWYHWCGTFSPGARSLTTDTPPTQDPRCGRCYGSKAGWLRERGLMFTPRLLDPPSRCPAYQSQHLVAWDKPRCATGVCLVCGDRVRSRAYGGWLGSWGAESHTPGPGLIEGCPFHGWRSLSVEDGRVMCICQMRPPRNGEW